VTLIGCSDSNPISCLAVTEIICKYNGIVYSRSTFGHAQRSAESNWQRLRFAVGQFLDTVSTALIILVELYAGLKNTQN